MKRGGIVWLNGRLVSAERARVPATLPLVLQGMGLYETLRIVRGRAPLVERHIARLARSARELGIRLRRRDWDGSIAELASHTVH